MVWPQRCSNILRPDEKKVSLSMDNIVPPDVNFSQNQCPECNRAFTPSPKRFNSQTGEFEFYQYCENCRAATKRRPKHERKPCIQCGETDYSKFSKRFNGQPYQRCKNCINLNNAEAREGVPPGHKRCSRCKGIKVLDLFYEDLDARNGLHSWCKECACSETWKKTYRKTSKVTPNYHAMLASQNGICKICGNPPQDGKKLHLDHCHRTGKIRGLLCANCNHGLGNFADSPDFLRRVAIYLEEA